jgi:hypothetical protein
MGKFFRDLYLLNYKYNDVVGHQHLHRLYYLHEEKN